MNFLREVIRRPREVGALAPSSENLTELMLETADLSGSETVIELGPGTGSFTGALAEQLTERGRLFALEKGASFSQVLEREFPTAEIYCGDALDLREHLSAAGITQADRIISGLPWANFSADKQAKILAQVTDCLAGDGLFLTFAYRPFHRFSRGRALRRQLEDTFSEVTVTRTVPNIPPAFIYRARL